QDEADFFSVLLHEITHGLGFSSLLRPDGSSDIAPGIFTSFDELLFDGVTALRVLTNPENPGLQAGAESLTGNNLSFDGDEAFDRYAEGTRPPIFAPNAFQPGSSISHWDTDTLV